MPRWWPFGKAPQPDPNQQIRNEVERLELEVKAKSMRAVAESISVNSQYTSYDDIYGPDQGFGDYLQPGYGGGAFAIDRNRQGSLPQAYLGEQQLRIARERSRYLSVANEFARNCLETRKNYIVGQGFQVSPVARQEDKILDEALEQEVKDWLQEFEAVNKWGLMQREGVFRGDRDGEAFFRLFFMPSGMTRVLFVEPEFVKGSSNDASFGIETDPDDVSQVLAFHITMPGKDAERVDASEIVYAKCNTDQGVKRGLPFLYPIHGMMSKIEKLDDTMITTSIAQASYAVIRKNQTARQASIATQRSTNASYTATNPLSGQTDYYRQQRGGMVVDVDANTEYEFPAAGVSIPGFVAAKESMLRTAAVGVCMPEYMFTSDASNGNFASTQVAESPSVMGFMSWQYFWSQIYGEGVYVEEAEHGILWRAMEYAVKSKKLDARVLTDVRLKFQGPQIIVRDRLQETQRLQTLEGAGVIDNDQWAAEEGYPEAAVSSEDKAKQEEAKIQQQLQISSVRHRGQNAAGPPK